MKLLDKQAIFAQNVAKLLQYMASEGDIVTLGECYRTPEQAALNAKKGIGIVNSLHCKRLAVDLNLFDGQHTLLNEKSSYKPFGEYWKKLHPLNRWGGDFVHLVDSGHFEMQDL